MAKMDEYKISVLTSDVKDAGTDANAHVYLFGDQGQSRKVPLKDVHGTKRSFNNKDLSEFDIEIKDVGDLSRIM